MPKIKKARRILEDVDALIEQVGMLRGELESALSCVDDIEESISALIEEGGE